jgi:threonine dehydrogenase-like Zn-dependent dehydrogenase
LDAITRYLLHIWNHSKHLSAATMTTLPSTMRALVLDKIGSRPIVKEIPTPKPGPGSAVVEILAVGVLPYANDVYVTALRNYPMPIPLTIGSSGVGRIAAVGPDSVSLQPGQLVLVDCYIRARDDKEVSFLAGLHDGHTPAAKKLAAGEWRDWTYAEYCKVPLENCFVLDEERLVVKLGYSVNDLVYLARLMVPHGGFMDVGLQAGETVVVAPASGAFGGAAVEVALGMGARVIVAGRRMSALKGFVERYPGRVDAVELSGDLKEDTEALKKLGPIHVFQDWSPRPAAQSTHLKACTYALARGGRVSLMGGINEDISFNYGAIMHQNLTIKGMWMYEPQDPPKLIRLVEAGLLKIGKSAGLRNLGSFGLDEWEEAFKTVDGTGYGLQVTIVPGKKL